MRAQHQAVRRRTSHRRVAAELPTRRAASALRLTSLTTTLRRCVRLRFYRQPAALFDACVGVFERPSQVCLPGCIFRAVLSCPPTLTHSAPRLRGHCVVVVSQAQQLVHAAGFPGAVIPGLRHACFEEAGAHSGFLSVPELKRAQNLAFERAGGHTSRASVLHISSASTTHSPPDHQPHEPHQRHSPLFDVHLNDGSIVRTPRVLVCAGSFCTRPGLLPAGIQLPATLQLKTEVVLLAELDADVAQTVSVLVDVPKQRGQLMARQNM